MTSPRHITVILYSIAQHAPVTGLNTPFCPVAVLPPPPPPSSGPTVILDQLYDNSSRTPVPEDPDRCLLVYPRQGSYCLFDGRLGHGVLDSFSSAQRTTMLVNWWESQPESVAVLRDEEIGERGMTRMESKKEQQAEQQQQKEEEEQQQQQEEKEQQQEQHAKQQQASRSVEESRHLEQEQQLQCETQEPQPSPSPPSQHAQGTGPQQLEQGEQGQQEQQSDGLPSTSCQQTSEARWKGPKLSNGPAAAEAAVAAAEGAEGSDIAHAQQQLSSLGISDGGTAAAAGGGGGGWEKRLWAVQGDEAVHVVKYHADRGPVLVSAIYPD